MSRIREYRAARNTADASISRLQFAAERWTGAKCETNHRDLLHAAREYGRSMMRLETMRGRK